MAIPLNLREATAEQMQDFLNSFDIVFSDCDGELSYLFIYLFITIYHYCLRLFIHFYVKRMYKKVYITYDMQKDTKYEIQRVNV